MEWLQTLLSGENGSAVQLVLITAALAILLIFLVWLFRKISGNATKQASRNRVPRLSISDSTAIDDKRYLVLVRRDNIEHLVLIGGGNDIVVESDIVRVPAAQQPAPMKAPAVAKDQDSAAKPEPADAPAAAAPIAAAATAGAATAAVVAAAGDLASAAEDKVNAAQEEITTASAAVVEEVPEAVLEEVSEGVEVASEAVEEIVDKLPEVEEIPTDNVQAAEEAIVVEEPEITPPEVEVAQVMEDNNPVEGDVAIDLESAITEKLDDALSGETIEVDTPAQETETPSPALDESAAADESDDEMQRLLDELAGEIKEPAQ